MTIEIRTSGPTSTPTTSRPSAPRSSTGRTSTWSPSRSSTQSGSPARTWAAFDGDRICGTFRSWATELTVPGGQALPASAVAARHGPADPPAAGHPHPTRRGRARGDPRPRRGVRAAVRLRVPDLRPVRLRAGMPGRDLDAPGIADAPGSTAIRRRSVELVGARRGGRRRRSRPCSRRGGPGSRASSGAATSAGTDDLGLRDQPVGPAVEGVPRDPSRRGRRAATATPATAARRSSSIASRRARSRSTSCTP